MINKTFVTVGTKLKLYKIETKTNIDTTRNDKNPN